MKWKMTKLQVRIVISYLFIPSHNKQIFVWHSLNTILFLLFIFESFFHLILLIFFRFCSNNNVDCFFLLSISLLIKSFWCNKSFVNRLDRSYLLRNAILMCQSVVVGVKSYKFGGIYIYISVAFNPNFIRFRRRKKKYTKTWYTCRLIMVLPSN